MRKKPDFYEVIVQNIGCTYKGGDVLEARKTFDEYQAQSKTGQGRAGGMSVDLYRNGEIYDQFIGEIEANGG